MVKPYLSFLFIVGFIAMVQKGQAQLIYFSDAVGELFTVDLSSGGCEVNSIGQLVHNGNSLVATDIAFHPNGKLYATDGTALYEINTGTLIATFIGGHNVGGVDFVNSLVCDSDGVMYAADTKLFTVDINNGDLTNLGTLPCESAGDLAFNNNELYLACIGNSLLKINFNNIQASQIVGTMMASAPFFGIVTFATECTDVQTFGTAGSGLYEVDITNAGSTLACTLTGADVVYGAAMETDFIASDCEVVLDLDGDDSSGADGIDYFADLVCGNFESMVADYDFSITTTIQDLDIDSIVFTISGGLLDGASEQLILEQAGTEYDVFGSGTNRVSAVNTAGQINAGAAHALENLRYLNIANPYTPGIREVSVQIFAHDDVQSDVAIAFINLVAPEAFTIDLGQDTVLCDGEPVLLDASYADAISYEWNDGSDDATLDVLMSGLYTVTVTNDCGSTATDDILVTFIPAVDVLDLGPDLTLCPGTSFTFDATLSDGIDYTWNTGTDDPMLEVTSTGLYAVSVTVGCGTQTDEVFVTYQEIPTESLFPDDTLICAGETLLLDATLEDALAYNWQDGSTDSTLLVNESGNYGVTVTLQCVEYTDEISVIYNDYELTLDLGPDTTFCFGDSVLLEAYTPYATNYLWQDGTAEDDFVVQSTGIYGVTVSDGCKSVSDQVSLTLVSCCNVFVPNVFSPNFDGTNDLFQTFSNCDFPDFELKVFNRWGGIVYQTNDQYDGWDGQFKGKDGQEGVYIWLMKYNDGIEDQVLSGDVTLVR